MNRLKAYLFVALAASTWGSLIVIMSIAMLIAYIYDKLVKAKWLYSHFLAQDHLVNVIFGGHFLTTVSSLLGTLKLRGSRGGTYMANFVDWCFYKLDGQENHCVNAIEKNDIFDFSARRALLGVAAYWLSLYVIFI